MHPSAHVHSNARNVLQKLSGEMKDHSLGPNRLRWRNGKLVAGTGKGRIRIWQKEGSSFNVLADWELKLDNVWSVDFDNDHVVVSNYRSAGRVLSVCTYDGHLLRTVCIGCRGLNGQESSKATGAIVPNQFQVT